jgi:hypothetical protein
MNLTPALEAFFLVVVVLMFVGAFSLIAWFILTLENDYRAAQRARSLKTPENPVSHSNNPTER